MSSAQLTLLGHMAKPLTVQGIPW